MIILNIENGDSIESEAEQLSNRLLTEGRTPRGYPIFHKVKTDKAAFAIDIQVFGDATHIADLKTVILNLIYLKVFLWSQIRLFTTMKLSSVSKMQVDPKSSLG